MISSDASTLSVDPLLLRNLTPSLSSIADAFEKGIIAFRLGYFQDAKKHFECVLNSKENETKKYESDANIFLGLALCRLDKNNLKKAQNHFKKALQTYRLDSAVDEKSIAQVVQYMDPSMDAKIAYSLDEPTDDKEEPIKELLNKIEVRKLISKHNPAEKLVSYCSQLMSHYPNYPWFRGWRAMGHFMQGRIDEAKSDTEIYIWQKLVTCLLSSSIQIDAEIAHPYLCWVYIQDFMEGIRLYEREEDDKKAIEYLHGVILIKQEARRKLFSSNPDKAFKKLFDSYHEKSREELQSHISLESIAADQKKLDALNSKYHTSKQALAANDDLKKQSKDFSEYSFPELLEAYRKGDVPPSQVLSLFESHALNKSPYQSDAYIYFSLLKSKQSDAKEMATVKASLMWGMGACQSQTLLNKEEQKQIIHLLYPLPKDMPPVFSEDLALNPTMLTSQADYKISLAVLKSMVTHNPLTARWYHDLAVVYLRLGEVDAALLRMHIWQWLFITDQKNNNSRLEYEEQIKDENRQMGVSLICYSLLAHFYHAQFSLSVRENNLCNKYRYHYLTADLIKQYHAIKGQSVFNQSIENEKLSPIFMAEMDKHFSDLSKILELRYTPELKETPSTKILEAPSPTAVVVRSSKKERARFRYEAAQLQKEQEAKAAEDKAREAKAASDAVAASRKEAQAARETVRKKARELRHTANSIFDELLNQLVEESSREVFSAMVIEKREEETQQKIATIDKVRKDIFDYFSHSRKLSIYLYGGSVLDYFLGNEYAIHDLDFAVSATRSDVVSLLQTRYGQSIVIKPSFYRENLCRLVIDSVSVDINGDCYFNPKDPFETFRHNNCHLNIASMMMDASKKIDVSKTCREDLQHGLIKTLKDPMVSYQNGGVIFSAIRYESKMREFSEKRKLEVSKGTYKKFNALIDHFFQDAGCSLADMKWQIDEKDITAIKASTPLLISKSKMDPDYTSYLLYQFQKKFLKTHAERNFKRLRELNVLDGMFGVINNENFEWLLGFVRNESNKPQKNIIAAILVAVACGNKTRRDYREIAGQCDFLIRTNPFFGGFLKDRSQVLLAFDTRKELNDTKRISPEALKKHIEAVEKRLPPSDAKAPAKKSGAATLLTTVVSQTNSPVMTKTNFHSANRLDITLNKVNNQP